jgi:hypothetical protein
MAKEVYLQPSAIKTYNVLHSPTGLQLAQLHSTQPRSTTQLAHRIPDKLLRLLGPPIVIVETTHVPIYPHNPDDRTMEERLDRSTLF